MQLRQRHRTLMAGVVISAACVLSCACGQGPAEPTAFVPTREGPPRNIVFLVVDTLRADALGCYGSSKSSPHIDAFAERGIIVERAHSHIPITGPSHASMFTGLLPVDHGVRNNTQELDDQLTTMAEVFQEAGYATAGVISLGVLQRRYGFAQGFDRFNQDFPTQWFRPAAEITDTALAMMERIGEQPFMLFVHYSDPHEPYGPPTLDYPRIEIVLNGTAVATVAGDGYGKRIGVELKGGDNTIELRPLDRTSRFVVRNLGLVNEGADLSVGSGWSVPAGSPVPELMVAILPSTISLRAAGSAGPINDTLKLIPHEELSSTQIQTRYAQEVEYADQEIGRLLSTLEERGLLQDTAVIMTADHGEGLGDHDLVGHIHQLYDSLTHVPLIVVAPGYLPQGVRSRSLVAHVDILPTVLDLMGLSVPSGLRGRSRLQELVSGEIWPEANAISMTYRPEAKEDLVSIVKGDLKLIRHSGSDSTELYDLKADPRELTPLSSSTPALSALDEELSKALAPLQHLPEITPEERELTEEERENLRALGYLEGKQ